MPGVEAVGTSIFVTARRATAAWSGLLVVGIRFGNSNGYISNLYSCINNSTSVCDCQWVKVTLLGFIFGDKSLDYHWTNIGMSVF